MKSLCLTALGFIILGLILTSHALYRSIDVYGAAIFGEKVITTPGEFIRKYKVKRARASGPVLYEYSSLDSDINKITSLTELVPEKTVTCENFNEICFNVGEVDLFDYIELIYFINLIMGMFSILAGILVFIFRNKIHKRINYVNHWFITIRYRVKDRQLFNVNLTPFIPIKQAVEVVFL